MFEIMFLNQTKSFTFDFNQLVAFESQWSAFCEFIPIKIRDVFLMNFSKTR